MKRGIIFPICFLVLGVGLALAAQHAPKSEGPASDIAPPGLPPVIAGSEDAAPSMPGGLTGGEISAIISSPPPAIPRILFPVRVRVSQGISSLLLLKRVNPEYPDAARRARVQGTVVMHAVIGKDGSVSKLELVSGHPMLVPVAMDAAKQWKYKPYLLNGQAMEVDTEILINFALPGIR